MSEINPVDPQLKPKSVTAIVTWTFIVILLIAHLVVLQVGLVYAAGHYALLPELVRHGEVMRLVTAMFLHVGWLHLFNNLFGLWIFGDRLKTELILGSRNTALIFFASGVFGNIVATFLMPPRTFSIGASGAVYGILGAYFGLVFYMNRRVEKAQAQQQTTPKKRASDVPDSPENASESANAEADTTQKQNNPPHWRTGLILFAAFIGLHYLEGQLNLWAHLGGLFSGIALGWFFAKQKFEKQIL